MASFSFDSTTVEAASGFEPIPAGTYPAVALSSELRVTKAGGEMAVYKMQITDGQYANRVIFARFNVKNATAKAQEIGLGQLSSFCRAAGVAQLDDTDDLLGRPVMMRVKIRPASGEYQAQNEVDGFAPATGGAAPAARPAAAPMPASSPRPAASTKPWEKAA